MKVPERSTASPATEMSELREHADKLQTEVERRAGVEEGLVAQLKLNRLQTADSERLFRLLVDSVKDYAIFVLGPAGHITTWNEGAKLLKGYNADEIIGQHFSRFYPPEDIAAGKCEFELEGATRTGRFEDEGWRVRKDGTRFWANVIISAIRDETGALVGFAKVTRDLTERRRSEQEAAARTAAEQANKMKDDFMAMLGHELRNPLAPIVSALQLLKLRGDVRSMREHQVIERQVNQMIRLVDDLLDVSRVSRGKIALQKRPIDLREVLANATEMSLPLIERRNHELDVQVSPYPLMLEADEARLTQVFSNLLNNAAKYTPEGGRISLAVKQHGQALSVEVSDNGQGIDAESLPRVFELFVQGYRDAEQGEGGLGIGLTLVRSLVELHGGRVEAHSPGRGLGSVFTVHLPSMLASEPVDAIADLSPVGASDPSQGRRVLVVDDNRDARELLALLLMGMGYDVKTASDGPTALALARTFKPEVAVLDIGLPGMSGNELAQALRKLEGGEQIQLFAVTGYGQPGDFLRSDAAGFDQHFVKPIDAKKLVASFKKHGV